MKRYALIQSGVCATVVEQASMPTIAGQWLDVTDLAVGPGHRWNGSVWTPLPASRRITRLAFSLRFTATEEADIEVASTDQANSPPAARKAQARIRVATRRLMISAYIDLDDPEIRALVQGYETAGYLAAGRAVVILNTPITTDEPAA